MSRPPVSRVLNSSMLNCTNRVMACNADWRPRGTINILMKKKVDSLTWHCLKYSIPRQERWSLFLSAAVVLLLTVSTPKQFSNTSVIMMILTHCLWAGILWLYIASNIQSGDKKDEVFSFFQILWDYVLHFTDFSHLKKLPNLCFIFWVGMTRKFSPGLKCVLCPWSPYTFIWTRQCTDDLCNQCNDQCNLMMA